MRARTLSLTFSLLVLAACGGGAADGPAALPPAATVADCLSIKSGYYFELRQQGVGAPDVRSYRNLAENFEGVPSLAHVEFRADGTRFSVTYYLTENVADYRGWIDYNILGVPNRKWVVSSTTFSVPLTTLTAGQSVQIQSIGVNSSLTTPPASAPATYTDISELRFEGLRTLTLAGRTFNNLCLTSQDVGGFFGAGARYYSWHAPGWGHVKAEIRDVGNNIISGHSYELSAVLATP